MTLSFFEEFDFDDAAETEPQRPAKGRRGRGEGGGSGPRRPGGDVKWQRLLPVAGAVVLVLVIGWLLLGAAIGAYGLLASALYRTGYASARLTVLIAAFAVAGTTGYALVANTVAPGLRSGEATLALTLVAFVAGVLAYIGMTLLPIAANRERFAPILADRWHLAIVAYAQGVTVLIGFLLLAVLGLA